MFGGKEFDESFQALNTYDFGARNYDPALGRWFNIDPFAEMMRSQSPYNFGFNNPIYFADYAGTIPWPLPEFFKNWRRKNIPDEYFGFIKRRGRNNNGLDLNYNGGGNTDLGAPIVATHSGRVARIIPLSANDGGGRVIEIESPDGSFQTKYMHLSSVVVQPGQEISEGQTIGLMGGSSFSKELGRTSHLHYEIHRQNSNGTYSSVNPWSNGNLIDPQRWISTMGPHLNASAYNSSSNSIFSLILTPEQYALVPKAPASVAASEPKTTVSPLSTTPSGITPLPTTPPGGIITPTPPAPVFIPLIKIPEPPIKT